MPRLTLTRSAASICALIGALAQTPVTAQVATPAATAIPPTTDTPYPGTLTLGVDASDLDRRIFRVRETIPVKPGPLTLCYPHWLPGNHAPTGKVDELAGLKISANGKPVEWRRDPVEVFAFHLVVPADASTLELEYQFLSSTGEASGRVVVTPEIVNLQWNAVLLYPAGHAVRGITVKPSLRLPEGFAYGSALDEARRSGATIEFKPVDADTLVDSPVFAGKYLRRIDLDPDARSAGRVPVFISIVADAPREFELKPEQIDAHRALVAQADKLFGARHYPRYEFLLAISEELGGIGLEHHASSENGVRPGWFTTQEKSSYAHDLLAHEYTHSWNGKFRRPTDLWTPDFAKPMQDSLLWMYEGQTQFWGDVLAARSGLMPLADIREEIANVAAVLSVQPGRAWRNLQDTTTEPIVNGHNGHSWPDWQRSADYYNEMVLVWLEADMLIREKSAGKRSLDDFARAFFGPTPQRGATETTPLTYTFDDIVAELNRVQPYDWTGFLRDRLDAHEGNGLLGGLARAGWRLAWTEKPTEYYKNVMSGYRHKSDDFYYSLGFDVGHDAKLKNLRWGGPAFNAGLSNAAQLLAVNGRSYTPERLADAVTAAKSQKDAGKAAIQLLVKDGDVYRTVTIAYSGGLRYPALERIEGTQDRLQLLLQAK
jgi:predicted metalloprotease with PDZ domain